MSSFHILQRIRKFFRQDADYFRNNDERIQERNSKMLSVGCLVYMCVLILYTLYECILGHSRLLIEMYFAFDAIHVALTCVVLLWSRKSKREYMPKALYVVFELALLGFFAVEGIFPYPDLHALYFQIPIFLVIVLFVHRAGYMLSLIFVYTAGYAVLAHFFKQPVAAANDMRVAGATLIAALVGYVLISQTRFSEGLAIQRLEYFSSIDGLTGIYNRQTSEKMCHAYIENVNGANACPYAVIVTDLDDFKKINDHCGHHMGDEVLRRFGGMLESTFYDKDIVGRFGGDEFIVLMRNNAGSTLQVRQKMKTVLKKAAQINIQDLNREITCCIGVAYVDGARGQKQTFDELFILADQALYKAKANGKNQIVIHDVTTEKLQYL